MGIIRDSLEYYENLRKYRFHIEAENNISIDLQFGRENYHHLVGFQYLKDLPDIWNPINGAQKFYRDLKSQKIKESYIESSVKFKKIEERIAKFSSIDGILESYDGKIIVDFDPSIADSLIAAKYLLFKREGNPLITTASYYSLFIDNRDGSDKYFARSFLVEHSGLYLRDQRFLDCSIQKCPLKKK